MCVSFLYFIERLGLTDVYFEHAAETLVLTRSEFSALDRLSRKGFFSSARIKAMTARGWIRPAPKASADADVEKGVHPSIRQSAAAYRTIGAKMVICEDPVLRRRAEASGMKVVATPEVIHHMAKKGVVDRARAIEAIAGLELIGWHDRSLLARVKEEIQCLSAGQK